MPTDSQALTSALQLHQSGNLPQAEQLYNQILQADPNNADAHHLLGVLAFQSGRPDHAVVSIRRAVGLNPQAPLYHQNLAIAQEALGQVEDALTSHWHCARLQPESADAYLNLGNVYFKLGRLGDAAVSYRLALKINSNNAAAYNNLGNALRELGRIDEAVDCLRQALLINPYYAEALNNLGNALTQQGRNEEAVECFHQALHINNNYAEALNNLGVALKNLDRLEEAEAQYRRALLIVPHVAELHSNLGSVLERQGQFTDAISCYEQATKLKPANADAWYNLAHLHQIQHKLDEAERCYREALRLRPNHVEGLNNIADVLCRKEKYENAIKCLQEALRHQPDYADTHYNLGTAYCLLGKVEEAVACFQEAVRLKPDHSEAHAARCGLLGAKSLSEGKLAEAGDVLQTLDRSVARRVYLQHLDGLQFTARLNEFDAVLNQARILFPDDVYLDAAALYRRHFDETVKSADLAAEYHRWAAHYFPEATRCPLSVAPLANHDRIRIAYVGTYLHYSFMDNILRHHDKRRFDVSVFTDDVRVDLAKAYAGLKVYAVHGNDLVKSCRDLEIAIAVDVVGPVPFRGGIAQLTAFQMRLAPIQCLWIATLNTTGSSAYDYLIADWQMAGQEQEGLYAEGLARLPNTWLCWTPPPVTVAPGPLPARRNGAITFGSANRAFKMNPTQLRLWAKILAACPGSRFHVKGPSAEDRCFMDRFCDILDQEGVSADRLLASPYSPDPNHLKFYQEIDISLDTYPHNGGITTLKSLWMGVPVVSRSGDGFTSRFSRSYLYHLGCSAWVAASEEEYVQRACELSANLDALEHERRTLRERLLRSTICNGPAFTRQLENLYTQMLKADGKTHLAVK